MRTNLLTATAMAMAMTSSFGSLHFGLCAREIPPTPEPEQTPEQRDFYLRRAAEKRARKAARKAKP